MVEATFPQFLRAQRPRASPRPRPPGEGPRHLAGVDLERVPRSRARHRPRPGEPGLPAGRQDRLPQRQSARAVRGHGGRPGGRRRAGAALPGRHRARTAVRDRSRRYPVRLRRGPGAGRQDPRPEGQPPRVESVDLRRPQGTPALQGPAADEPRGAGDPRTRARRGAPGLFEELVAAGPAGRHRAHLATPRAPRGRPRARCSPTPTSLTPSAASSTIERYESTDEILAYLPAAWIGDTFWSLAGSLHRRLHRELPGASGDRPSRTSREIGPQVLVAPPRIWENLVSTVQVKMDDASWVKRRLARWLMPVGEEVARAPDGEAAGPVRPAAAPRPRRVLRLRPSARPPGIPAHPLRLHGRGPPRPGGLPVLPRHRHQPQAGVRPDRDHRASSCVQRDGDIKLGHGGQAVPGHGGAARRRRAR